MEHSEITPSRKMGRPLSFDRNAALRAAMLTFWRHGYETTSIRDLTSAMGVTTPSIYAAFGDKKRLFLEAMRLYVGDPDLIDASIRDAPTAKEAARFLLMSSAEVFTGVRTPPGCLLASAAAGGSEESADVRAEVAKVQQRIEGALRQRITCDMVAGILPETTPADSLSGMVMAVIQGMSLLARNGVGREKLQAISELTLKAWPLS